MNIDTIIDKLERVSLSNPTAECRCDGAAAHEAARILRACRAAGFIDEKGEVRKSGNPPDFHRLSDLSPEDLSLVEQMAAFICKAESIDDKQDSLNTMLEVLDQRPLEVVEFDRALADCHGTWSYFGSDYIEALRTARARVGEAFRQAVREVAKEADHDKA